MSPSTWFFLPRRISSFTPVSLPLHPLSTRCLRLLLLLLLRPLHALATPSNSSNSTSPLRPLPRRHGGDTGGSPSPPTSLPTSLPSTSLPNPPRLASTAPSAPSSSPPSSPTYLTLTPQRLLSPTLVIMLPLACNHPSLQQADQPSPPLCPSVLGHVPHRPSLLPMLGWRRFFKTWTSTSLKMPHQTIPSRVVCVVQLRALFSIAPFTTVSLSLSALVPASRCHFSALMCATIASRAFLSSERRRVISAASSSPSALLHLHPTSSPFAVLRQAPLTLTLSSLRSRTLPAL